MQQPADQASQRTGSEDASVTVDLDPFDIHATMARQLLGKFDPTGRRSRDGFEKVHLDGQGRPLTWQVVSTSTGFRVQVSGDDASGALDAFLAQFPLADGCGTDLLPQHPLLSRLARAYAGLRMLRVPWPFDVAAGAILQQRVRWQVGCNDFRRIARRWGTRTPAGVTFPSARDLARVSVAAIEEMGIDVKRARALGGLARLEATRPFLAGESDPERLRKRLLQVPGIGPWTANMIAGYAMGDPDAVPVGDLHLPSLVTSTLAGEPEGSDDRMLELLEPWRGQRFRIVRLLVWSARRSTGRG
jgi:3-methyladenine DNA glycosylase/8-oxoguanine DNA glycosylase